MPNRVYEELNHTIAEANAISEKYTKGYMESVSEVQLDSSMIANIDGINMYYRLEEYSLYEEHEKNKERVALVAKSIASMTGVMAQPFSISLTNYDRKFGCYLGTNYEAATQLKEIICGNLFQTKIANEGIPFSAQHVLQHYNGIVCGTNAIDVGSIDRVLNALGSRNYMINILLVPIPNEYVSIERDRVNQYLEDFERVIENDVSIGTQRQRRVHNTNQSVADAISILEQEKERLVDGSIRGLWYAFVHVGAPSYQEYCAVSSEIVSLFHNHADTKTTKSYCKVVCSNMPALCNNAWNLPLYKKLSNEDGIYQYSLLNIVTLEESSNLIAIPVYSHESYLVRHVGESSITEGAFVGRRAIREEDEAIHFGKMDNGDLFCLPTDCLTQHLLVVGATRSGKTTTVIKMLNEFNKQGIQFIVVETSKKEYWKMIGIDGMEYVKVYSAGRDGRILKINPFQPENGTLLENHIQALIQAFLSLFDETDPLPQILTDLIYTCYEKRGWNPARRVKGNEKTSFPTLTDMLDNLDSCIDSIGYGEEVKNNMRGVLNIRIKALIRQCGEMLNSSENTDIGELFDGSAIIELDDFATRNKPFVALIIAMKVNEYVKQVKPTNKLTRVFVVEEAHNVIPNPELHETSGNTLGASRFFMNMLAEVGASGTGIIIVDQRPSALSAGAIANTGTKVIHALKNGEDMDVVSKAISLKEIEKGQIPNLATGQAVISLPQQIGCNRIKVDPISLDGYTNHIETLFCTKASQKTLDYITDFEKQFIIVNGYRASSVAECVESIESRIRKKLNYVEKIQIAGKLAKSIDENPLTIRQELFEYSEVIS